MRQVVLPVRVQRGPVGSPVLDALHQLQDSFPARPGGVKAHTPWPFTVQARARLWAPTHRVSDVWPFTPKAPKMPHMASESRGAAKQLEHRRKRVRTSADACHTTGGGSHAPCAAPALAHRPDTSAPARSGGLGDVTLVTSDPPAVSAMAAPTSSGRAKADTAVDTAILRETIRKEEKCACSLLSCTVASELTRVRPPGTPTSATTSASPTQ